MQFEKLSNFRDVGGVETADGRIVKTGMLFRSDELSRITERDLAKLHELGIKLVCDLRSPGEIKRRGRAHAIEVVQIPLSENEAGNRKQLLGFLFGKTGADDFRDFSRRTYNHIAFEQTARIREVFTLLAEEGHLPAVIHCQAGKDRTGYIVALILLSLGVPYERVLADYLRTNDQYEPRLAKLIRVMRIATLARVSEQRIRLVLMAHPEFLDEVHDRIIKTHGSVAAYLREACGVEPATLDTLKRRLL